MLFQGDGNVPYLRGGGEETVTGKAQCGENRQMSGPITMFSLSQISSIAMSPLFPESTIPSNDSCDTKSSN